MPEAETRYSQYVTLATDMSYGIEIHFPKIGKGKPKKVKLVAFSEESIKPMVRDAVKRFTVELIEAYSNSQSHRLATSQVMSKLRAISDLKTLVRSGHHKDARFLSIILQHMVELATTNRQSQFFQYDQDAVAYIRSLIPTPKTAVS